MTDATARLAADVYPLCAALSAGWLRTRPVRLRHALALSRRYVIV